MTSTSQDFVRVLDAESEVDIALLMDMSTFGVPDDVRGLVWRYLLGLITGDKCMSHVCRLCRHGVRSARVFLTSAVYRSLSHA